MITLNLYRVKEVGSDYIVLADDATDVRITFAGGSGSKIENDNLAITKEENAQFFNIFAVRLAWKCPLFP